MGNVLRIGANKTEKTVYERIESFLSDKGSKNTQVAYRKDIQQFFYFMKNKNLEELTVEDIVGFDNDDIILYKGYIKDRYGEYSTTINRKITTIRSLYKHLSSSIDGIDLNIFNITRVSEEINSYGNLSLEETDEMIELAKDLNNGLEKSLFLELAVYTSIRLEALLNLTWSRIYKNNREDNYWLVKVYDKKHKKDIKPITNDLYERLVQIKRQDDNCVFTVSKRTIQRTIDELVQKMNIPKERNIKFHSLKKVAINWIIDTTGDIKQAAIQANHKNIQTTFKHYLDRTKKYDTMAGVLMGKKLDLSPLEELNKEELIQLIKNASLTTKSELIKMTKGGGEFA